ncbi:hypothetical protein SAMN05421676_108113 [Salinibacillus kushneri]|uniref:Uncharacterized protein n=1 Tax=Salinibacillus kushneri TaxID=237682 RepID=A0A1I0H8N9_9BACI|nr:hypothetical protein SAMN05421676_108113 [Salinibacillus kushneri]
MVRLDKMNSSEFKQYLEYAIRHYAGEHVKAGNWNEKNRLVRRPMSLKSFYPKEKKLLIISCS